MKQTLIPQNLLYSSNKILFLTHCALGDFLYLRPFLKKLKEEYPHLQIDFWPDEVRRTHLFWKWKYTKNYVLFDWLRDCNFLHKIYTSTYSWKTFKHSLRDAKQENYPIIISLVILKNKKYASYAHAINPSALIVGTQSKKSKTLYKELDIQIPDYPNCNSKFHISDLFAFQFNQLFGLEVVEKDRCTIDMPNQWKHFGITQCKEWGIGSSDYKIFINIFAKNKKRSWTVPKLLLLITLLNNNLAKKNCVFIVNAPPQCFDELSCIFSQFKNVFLFKGSDNFFQIPSMISSMDYVVSVETSIMHFAAAFKKPLLSMMRIQNPEWMPWGITNDSILFLQNRNHWIKEITVFEVFQKIMLYFSKIDNNMKS